MLFVCRINTTFITGRIIKMKIKPIFRFFCFIVTAAAFLSVRPALMQEFPLRLKRRMYCLGILTQTVLLMQMMRFGASASS